MKQFALFIILALVLPYPASAATVVFLTSGTTYTVPSDWTLTNTIECIGAGGNGRIASLTVGRPGGGGGAYAQVSNLSLSGSVSYVIASGGSQSDTYFNGAASTSASISCAGGKNATSLIPGAGGSTANSTGTVKYAGGSGASGDVCSGGDGSGGGGGGAGGPYGAGLSADFSTGGDGGGGFGGASGGGSGREWNYGAGAGSGGGGHGLGGYDGGFYGGGGGGGGSENCFYSSTPGSGIQGIIVVTYWPTLSSMVKIWGGKTQIRGGKVRIY